MMRHRSATVLLAAICLCALPSQAVAADGGPGVNELGWSFYERPAGATSVSLCWGGESLSTYESWVVRVAAGTTPPSADATPVAVVPGEPTGACYTGSGLAAGEPYTFRITGQSADGESAPAFHTLAGRVPGMFVLNGSAQERLPWGDSPLQLAVTSKDRRWHAIFAYAPPAEHRDLLEIFYSTRAKDGWTQPEPVGGNEDAVLAANATTVAVAWNDWLARYRPRYRLRTGHATAFGARRTVPLGTGYDRVADAALDRRGHMHLLTFGLAQGTAVRYASNASGKWREEPIPQLGACDRGQFYAHCIHPPLLAYDAVSDRIAVVAQNKGVRIATARASAKKLGPFRVARAVNRRHLDATSLTTCANRITLGLESQPEGTYPSQASGPLYVATDGRVVRVPGTSANDWGVLVAARSADRVILAWMRRSPTWDRSEQGIWTAESVRDPDTGRWSIHRIRHVTHSHYDTLTSLAVTAAGRPLVAYTRAAFVETP
jgi:hypothetical protein